MIEINTEPTDERKLRKVTLHKNLMEHEIDAHTSKFVDAAGVPTLRQENAISSDTDESLDGSIISRLMDYRDAELRKLLVAFIQKETVYEVDNLNEQQATFEYKLLLEEDFNDANLRPLCALMNKYIVWGCLFDWYSQLGSVQAGTYGSQLEKVEEDLLSMVSTEGYAKRPLQPFGPANKY